MRKIDVSENSREEIGVRGRRERERVKSDGTFEDDGNAKNIAKKKFRTMRGVKYSTWKRKEGGKEKKKKSHPSFAQGFVDLYIAWAAENVYSGWWGRKESERV